jgi:hypothetical protein
MVGLCILAVFALSATAVVVASPAYAACNAECQEQKEKEKAEAKKQKEEEKAAAQKLKEEEKEAAKKAKEEAKEAKIREKREASGVGDPWGVNDWHAYKHCPLALEETEQCFTGITSGGKKGGFFQYGNVKVALDKSIKLQGGYKGAGSNIEVIPAAGAETLEAPLLDVDGGISVITPLIQQQAKWPQALVEAFNEVKKNKESEIDVKIELAGTELFEIPGSLNTENILFEEGIAFKLPLKVKVTGPFLEKLGGGPCYLGSDENPIHINLTTQGAGSSGELEFNRAFDNVFLQGSRLVDFGWHIPIASGAKGCGGEYEAYVDRALNLALEVEYGYEAGAEVQGRRGIVVLQGDLHDGAARTARKEAEAGKV